MDRSLAGRGQDKGQRRTLDPHAGATPRGAVNSAMSLSPPDSLSALQDKSSGTDRGIPQLPLHRQRPGSLLGWRLACLQIPPPGDHPLQGPARVPLGPSGGAVSARPIGLFFKSSPPADSAFTLAPQSWLCMGVLTLTLPRV